MIRSGSRTAPACRRSPNTALGTRLPVTSTFEWWDGFARPRSPSVVDPSRPAAARRAPHTGSRTYASPPAKAPCRSRNRQVPPAATKCGLVTSFCTTFDVPKRRSNISKTMRERCPEIARTSLRSDYLGQIFASLTPTSRTSQIRWMLVTVRPEAAQTRNGRGFQPPLEALEENLIRVPTVSSPRPS
jgi:hypothetical protein